MQKVCDWTKEHTLRTFASGASSVPGAHQGWFIGEGVVMLASRPMVAPQLPKG